MAVSQELAYHLQQAGRIEDLNLLPVGASFFQQKLAELVTWKLGEDGLGSSPTVFRAACRETFDRLRPLVDFLTQPRSIQGFQDLKKGLLEIMSPSNRYLSMSGEDEQGIDEIVDWLDYLSPEIKIFPFQEFESLSVGQPWKEVWEAYEEIGTKPLRPVEEKIKSLEEAAALAEEVRNGETGRVGYVIGKWRLGPHKEHIALFEEARKSLGTDGVLFVAVESQRSIWQRRGRDHFALPDQERLERIAALEAVDYAILFDPSDEELKDLEGFYYQADRKFYRDLWFIGTEDYHWRPDFERRAMELGMIILWRSPTTSLSTSELIAQIRQAS